MRMGPRMKKKKVDSSESGKQTQVKSLWGNLRSYDSFKEEICSVSSLAAPPFPPHDRLVRKHEHEPLSPF